MKHLILLIAFIMCLSACKTQKQTTSIEQTSDVRKTTSDSVFVREVHKTEAKTIDADTVKLRLTPEDIERLPTGSSFNQKSGRATLNVSQSDDGNIEIMATCDSIWVLYANLYMEYYQYKKEANDSIYTLNKNVLTLEKQSIWDKFQKQIGGAIIVILLIIIIIFCIKQWL